MVPPPVQLPEGHPDESTPLVAQPIVEPGQISPRTARRVEDELNGSETVHSTGSTEALLTKKDFHKARNKGANDTVVPPRGGSYPRDNWRHTPVAQVLNREVSSSTRLGEGKGNRKTTNPVDTTIIPSKVPEPPIAQPRGKQQPSLRQQRMIDADSLARTSDNPPDTDPQASSRTIEDLVSNNSVEPAMPRSKTQGSMKGGGIRWADDEGGDEDLGVEVNTPLVSQHPAYQQGDSDGEPLSPRSRARQWEAPPHSAPRTATRSGTQGGIPSQRKVARELAKSTRSPRTRDMSRDISFRMETPGHGSNRPSTTGHGLKNMEEPVDPGLFKTDYMERYVTGMLGQLRSGVRGDIGTQTDVTIDVWAELIDDDDTQYHVGEHDDGDGSGDGAPQSPRSPRNLQGPSAGDPNNTGPFGTHAPANILNLTAEERAQFEKAFVTQMMGEIEIALPPSKVPKEFWETRTAEVRQMLEEFQNVEITHDEEAKLWNATLFPSKNPSSRMEVVYLARCLEAMLGKHGRERDPNLTSRPELNRREPWKNTETLKKLDVSNVYLDEIKIWDLTWSEIIRQVQVHCTERGVLLERVRRRYADCLEDILYGFTAAQDCIQDLQERLTYKEALLEESLAREKQLPIDFEIAKEAALAGLREELRLSNERVEKEKADRWKTQEELWKLEKRYRRLKEIVATGDINLEELEAQIEGDDEEDGKGGDDDIDPDKPLFGRTMDTMLDALTDMEKQVQEDQKAKEEALAKQNAKGFKGTVSDDKSGQKNTDFQLPRISKMGQRMDSTELLPDPEESDLAAGGKQQQDEVKLDELVVGKNSTQLLEQSAMQLIQFGVWMQGMEELVSRLEDEDSDEENNDELMDALTMTELVEQLVEKVNVISERLEKLVSEEEYERQRAKMQEGLMHLAEKKKKKKKKRKKGILETTKPMTKQEYDIKIAEHEDEKEEKQEKLTQEMTDADTANQQEIQELKATIQALQNTGQSSELEISRVKEDRDKLKAELAEQAEFDNREIAMLQDKIENLIAIEREDEKLIQKLESDLHMMEKLEEATEAELEQVKKAKEELETHKKNLEDTLAKKKEVEEQQAQIEKGNETDRKDKERLAALERELHTLQLAATSSPAEIERIKVEYEDKVNALENEMSEREMQYQEQMLRLAADHQVELERLQWEKEKAPDEEDPDYQAKMADPNAEWEEEETVWQELAVHTRQALSKEEAHIQRLKAEADAAKKKELEEKRRRRVIAKLEGREDELSDEEELAPVEATVPAEGADAQAPVAPGLAVMPNGMLASLGINPFTGTDAPKLSRDGQKQQLLRKFRELQGINQIHRNRKAAEEFKRQQEEKARLEAEGERFHAVGVQCGEAQATVGVQVQLGTASSWSGAATGGMSYPRVLKNFERMADKRKEEQLLSDRLFTELSMADEAIFGETLIGLEDLQEELDDEDQELEDELNAAKFVKQDGETTTCPHCAGFIIIPFGMSGGGADGDGNGGGGGGGGGGNDLDPYSHLMQSQMQQYEMEDEDDDKKSKFATGPDGKRKKGARSSRYGVTRDPSAVVLAGDLAEGFSCNNDRLREVVNKMLDSKIKPKSKTWLLRIMKDVYKDKRHHDDIADRDGVPHLSLPDFLFEYLKQLYGTKSLVDQTFYSIVNTMMLFRSDDLRVEVFARFVEEDWDTDLFDIYNRAKRLCDEAKTGISFLEQTGRGQELKERSLDTERASEVASIVLGECHPTAVAQIEKLIQENSVAMEPNDFKSVLPNPRQKAIYAKALEDLLVQNRRKMKLDFFLFHVCERHVIFERGYEAHIHEVFSQKDHNTGDGFMEREHFDRMVQARYAELPFDVANDMFERGLQASLNPAAGKIDYKGFSAMMLKSPLPRVIFRRQYVPPEEISTREATGGVDSKEQMSQFLQRHWTTFTPVFQESLQIFRSYTINDVTKTLGILSRSLQKSLNVEADGAKAVDAYRRLLAVIGTQLLDIQASFKLIGRADNIDVKKMEDEVAALEKAFMGVFDYVSKRVQSMAEPASRQLARSGAMGRIMGQLGKKKSGSGTPKQGGQANGALVVSRRRPGEAQPSPTANPAELAKAASKAGASATPPRIPPHGGRRQRQARVVKS